MKKHIFILLTAVFCASFTPGTWEASSREEFISAYKKAADWFTGNRSYRVNIQYLSFSNHTSLSPYDKSDGYYKRSNDNFSSSAMGINTYQNEEMKITVDTVNNVIVLTNKTDISKAAVDMESFAGLVDHSKSLKKMSGASGEKIYRLEFKPNDLYSAYEFSINEKGLLTGMKYFYSKEMKEDEDNKNALSGKPRVEIRFSNYETAVAFNYEKDFSGGQYIRKEGKKILPGEQYKDFEFKDYRVPVKK